MHFRSNPFKIRKSLKIITWTLPLSQNLAFSKPRCFKCDFYARSDAETCQSKDLTSNSLPETMNLYFTYGHRRINTYLNSYFIRKQNQKLDLGQLELRIKFWKWNWIFNQARLNLIKLIKWTGANFFDVFFNLHFWARFYAKMTQNKVGRNFEIIQKFKPRLWISEITSWFHNSLLIFDRLT